MAFGTKIDLLGILSDLYHKVQSSFLNDKQVDDLYNLLSRYKIIVEEPVREVRIDIPQEETSDPQALDKEEFGAIDQVLLYPLVGLHLFVEWYVSRRRSI